MSKTPPLAEHLSRWSLSRAMRALTHDDEDQSSTINALRESNERNEAMFLAGRRALEAALARTRADHAAEMNARTVRHQCEIDALVVRHQCEMQALRSQLRDQHERMREQHERELQARADVDPKLASTLFKMQQKLTATLAQLAEVKETAKRVEAERDELRGLEALRRERLPLEKRMLAPETSELHGSLSYTHRRSCSGEPARLNASNRSSAPTAETASVRSEAATDRASEATRVTRVEDDLRRGITRRSSEFESIVKPRSVWLVPPCAPRDSAPLAAVAAPKKAQPKRSKSFGGFSLRAKGGQPSTRVNAKRSRSFGMRASNKPPPPMRSSGSACGNAADGRPLAQRSSAQRPSAQRSSAQLPESNVQENVPPRGVGSVGVNVGGVRKRTMSFGRTERAKSTPLRPGQANRALRSVELGLNQLL